MGPFSGHAYADPNQVLGDLVKRLVNGVVLLLGALAFFLVPVGNKTPAQHVVAIFSTRPAKEAAVAFARAGKQITEQVMAEVERAKKNPPDMKIKQASDAGVGLAKGAEGESKPPMVNQGQDKQR